MTRKLLLSFAILFSSNIIAAPEINDVYLIEILIGERGYDDLLNKTKDALTFEKQNLLHAMQKLKDMVQKEGPTSDEILEMERLVQDVQDMDLFMEDELIKSFSELTNRYNNKFTDAEAAEIKGFIKSDVKRKLLQVQNNYLNDLNSSMDQYNESIHRKLAYSNKRMIEISKAVFKRKEENARNAPTPLQKYIKENKKNIIIADNALDMPSPESDLFKNFYQIASIDNYELVIRKLDDLENIIKNIKASKAVLAPFLSSLSEEELSFSAASMSLDTAMVSYSHMCQLPLHYSEKILGKFKLTARLKNVPKTFYCESLVYFLASNGLSLSNAGSKLSVVISPFETNAVKEGSVSTIKVRNRRKNLSEIN